MAANKSCLMGGTAADFVTDEIKTLDADGFTLGAGGDSNDSANTHYWFALAEHATIAYGSYVGDDVDNRAIASGTFRYALIMGDSTVHKVHRPDKQVGDAAHLINSSGTIVGDHIQQLTPSLQVGASAPVNDPGITYHYVTMTAGSAGSVLTSSIQDMWITAAEIHHDERAGTARLRLHLEGVLRRLRRLFQYTSIEHTTDDYRNILSGIMARAGASLSVTNASTRSDTIVPRFSIDPNTSAHTAMRQALAFIADRLHVDQGSSVNMQELVSGEASDYSLSNVYPDDPDEHPITRLRLRAAPPCR